MTSKRSLHAKYMWLMWARPPGDTVARAHRGEAFINRRATRSRVADENLRDLRSTVISEPCAFHPSRSVVQLPVCLRRSPWTCRDGHEPLDSVATAIFFVLSALVEQGCGTTSSRVRASIF